MDEALDQAIRVFCEQGYNATSIGDLIDAMGLASGSIYKAFRDKRAVFLAALDRHVVLRQGADRRRGPVRPSPRESGCATCLPSLSNRRRAPKDGAVA